MASRRVNGYRFTNKFILEESMKITKIINPRHSFYGYPECRSDLMFFGILEQQEEDVLRVVYWDSCRELFLDSLMNPEYDVMSNNSLLWCVVSRNIVGNIDKVDAALDLINSCATKYGFSKLEYKLVDEFTSNYRWRVEGGSRPTFSGDDIIYFEVSREWFEHYFLLSLICVFIRAFVEIKEGSIKKYIGSLYKESSSLMGPDPDFKELRLLVGYGKMEEIFKNYTKLFGGYKASNWRRGSGEGIGIRSVLYKMTNKTALNDNLRKVIGRIPCWNRLK